VLGFLVRENPSLEVLLCENEVKDKLKNKSNTPRFVETEGFKSLKIDPLNLLWPWFVIVFVLCLHWATNHSL
jgi:hypothetical protein